MPKFGGLLGSTSASSSLTGDGWNFCNPLKFVDGYLDNSNNDCGIARIVSKSARSGEQSKIMANSREKLNNIMFLSKNYRLIVGPWSLMIYPKTNSCPRSEASEANMLVSRTSNFHGTSM